LLYFKRKIKKKIKKKVDFSKDRKIDLKLTKNLVVIVCKHEQIKELL